VAGVIGEALVIARRCVAASVAVRGVGDAKTPVKSGARLVPLLTLFAQRRRLQQQQQQQSLAALIERAVRLLAKNTVNKNNAPKVREGRTNFGRHRTTKVDLSHSKMNFNLVLHPIMSTVLYRHIFRMSLRA
jgi:hypothetical protein